MASVATENDLHSELLTLYTRTGVATGYWAHCSYVKYVRTAGLAVAKKLLRAAAAVHFSGKSFRHIDFPT